MVTTQEDWFSDSSKYQNLIRAGAMVTRLKPQRTLAGTTLEPILK